MKTRRTFLRNRGMGMIEVLVALIILMLGLLGLAGMMMQSQRSEGESYQRVQALILAQDMVNRINANRKVATCYAFTTDAANGTPFLGTGSEITPACTEGSAQQNAQAVSDLEDWHALLSGAAVEAANGDKVGAMFGARGCVSFDAASGNYLVSVAWQGLGKTAAPPASWPCAKGVYGEASATADEKEAQRRVVSVLVRIGSLT